MPSSRPSGEMSENTSSYYAPLQSGTAEPFTPPMGRNEELEAESSAPMTPVEQDLSEFPLGAARGQLHETYIISQTEKRDHNS